MKMLGNAFKSLYFWPIVTLSAVAVFFFGWAVQISAQNWAGQAAWGTLATIIVVVMVVMAVRDSHRMSVSRLASARRLSERAPR
jgi:hypothetical protein